MDDCSYMPNLCESSEVVIINNDQLYTCISGDLVESWLWMHIYTEILIHVEILYNQNSVIKISNSYTFAVWFDGSYLNFLKSKFSIVKPMNSVVIRIQWENIYENNL